jgi:hypothetical protein
MAETKQTITVGVSNQGERNMTIEELLKYEPKKITYTGSQVLFEHNDVFLLMNTSDFKQIFNK